MTLQLALAAFGLALVIPAAAQQGKVDCKKPPEFIKPTKESKEQKDSKPTKKQLKTPINGAVKIQVSENGDVVDATPVPPTSGELADHLVSAAKAMKFEPRPGCGAVTFEVNFHLHDSVAE